ncbi:hypothetical protein AX15_000971 [Amanita polypyramis BW_CC]|nr:hypothetical protein AX15_000971 [Amanita polypyramis BW_CC]
MHGDIVVTFLGTSSGGGPTRARNCSSLVCDMLRDGSLWMVDCAEGTIRQFYFQPHGQPTVRAGKVTKLFITHMHADHIMGIITFLRNVLHPPQIGPSGQEGPYPAKTVEIYGPAGLRSFIRQNFRMTASYTADHYVVHELLTSHDRVTPCNDFIPPTEVAGFSQASHDWDIRHPSEERGRDIYTGEDNFWRSIVSGEGHFGNIAVDAGPIYHRDPCIGYVFRETSGPQRKVVILGDTSNPNTIIPLCVNPSPSLLVHEATDAHIPYYIDAKLGRRDAEEVLSKTIIRGHSSPGMAGTFARTVDAQRLVLNHIGARFPGPSGDTTHRNWHIIAEIQNQASEAWGSRRQAEVAYDHVRVVVPSNPYWYNHEHAPFTVPDNNQMGYGVTVQQPLQQSLFAAQFPMSQANNVIEEQNSVVKKHRYDVHKHQRSSNSNDYSDQQSKGR